MDSEAAMRFRDCEVYIAYFRPDITAGSTAYTSGTSFMSYYDTTSNALYVNEILFRSRHRKWPNRLRESESVKQTSGIDIQILFGNESPIFDLSEFIRDTTKTALLFIHGYHQLQFLLSTANWPSLIVICLSGAELRMSPMRVQNHLERQVEGLDGIFRIGKDGGMGPPPATIPWNNLRVVGKRRREAFYVPAYQSRETKEISPSNLALLKSLTLRELHFVIQ
ncbi:hypothetical protein J6590_016889 [Homalodisca vitripennis]|nr:hypothetical protein J6590_016889 [Homalodisca vitripennis]